MTMQNTDDKQVWLEVENGFVHLFGNTYMPCETYSRYNGELDGTKVLFRYYGTPNGELELHAIECDTPYRAEDVLIFEWWKEV